MSIFDVLKRIKFPSFEEDFIQDPTERAIEDAPVSYGGKVVHDPRRDPSRETSRENLRDWMGKESEKNSDPADPASGDLWING